MGTGFQRRRQRRGGTALDESSDVAVAHVGSTTSARAPKGYGWRRLWRYVSRRWHRKHAWAGKRWCTTTAAWQLTVSTVQARRRRKWKSESSSWPIRHGSRRKRFTSFAGSAAVRGPPWRHLATRWSGRRQRRDIRHADGNACHWGSTKRKGDAKRRRARKGHRNHRQDRRRHGKWFSSRSPAAPTRH